jgi:acetyl esterase/lipase
MPVVVWIHGGAWEGGSKAASPAVPLASRGFVVASIGYRLSQAAPFPAQIQDVKAAIRWLRGHASDYRIDPDRIGVWGISAGGHLAALLGTSSGTEEFEVGDYLDQPSNVQAVADWCGPTDILRFKEHPSTVDRDRPGSMFERLFGGPVLEKKELVEKANPIAYVDPKDPPFLIMHGDKDPLVPQAQSELLATALKDANVPVDFEIVKGGKHVFVSQETLDAVFEFFEKTLKPAQPPKPAQ